MLGEEGEADGFHEELYLFIHLSFHHRRAAPLISECSCWERSFTVVLMYLARTRR